jgi:hypothetical protein
MGWPSTGETLKVRTFKCSDRAWKQFEMEARDAGTTAGARLRDLIDHALEELRSERAWKQYRGEPVEPESNEEDITLPDPPAKRVRDQGITLTQRDREQAQAAHDVAAYVSQLEQEARTQKRVRSLGETLMFALRRWRAAWA